MPETYYNKILTDYTDIVGYTDKPFDKKVYEEYMTHVPYEALHGFTVESL